MRIIIVDSPFKKAGLEESCELTKGLQTKLGGLLQKAEDHARALCTCSNA